MLYISPWIVGFAIFLLYPICASMVYSFTNFDMMRKFDFIGFRNFINAFTQDDDFFNSLRVTTIYVLFAVPLKITFALFVAIVLSARLRAINFFRTVYYLPSILGGSVAIAVLWRFLFMKEGVVNTFLSCLHIPAVNWLGDPGIALYTVSLLTVWQFGSSMIIFLAGIKQIPAELYEAGKVDGASPIRMFFKITVPFLTPLIFFNLVMQMINAFQEFTGAFVITNGGPMKSTYLFAIKLYDEAFKFYKMGYASALSWILFFIIMLFTAFIFKSSSYWVYYEDGGESK